MRVWGERDPTTSSWNVYPLRPSVIKYLRDETKTKHELVLLHHSFQTIANEMGFHLARCGCCNPRIRPELQTVISVSGIRSSSYKELNSFVLLHVSDSGFSMCGSTACQLSEVWLEFCVKSRRPLTRSPREKRKVIVASLSNMARSVDVRIRPLHKCERLAWR
ncbi:hypothetical protein BDV19DRAFT_158609 [Aspergillus venezuelensis]